jgi:hypothetical protein
VTEKRDELPNKKTDPALESEAEIHHGGGTRSGESSALKPVSWVVFLILFFGAIGAGLWAGGHFIPSYFQWKSDQKPSVGVTSSSMHVAKGLFFPLEDGRRTLYLSLSLRIGEQDLKEGHPIDHQLLYGSIFEAVQGMEATELMGRHGIKSLKGRILRLTRKRYPELKIEDVHFLDYTIF